MTGRTNVEESANVLIVEDEGELADIFVRWLGEIYTVEIASDCETALRVLDATIDIVLVAREFPDGTSADIAAAIQTLGLDCGVVLVAAVEQVGDSVTTGVDACLVTPVNCAEVRSTVAQVCQLVQYDRMLSAFFAVASKKARLETHVPPAELEQADEYETLLARTDALKRKLAALTSAFTPSQFDALWQRGALADRHEASKRALE